MTSDYIYNPENLNQYLTERGFSLADVFNMGTEQKSLIWTEFRDFGIQKVTEKVEKSETDWEPIEIND